MLQLASRRSVPARRAAVIVLAAAAVLAFAAPASAHVSVSPQEATRGDFARLAFRVPAESDTASTTKVEIFLPEDAPVASVSTMRVAGWTVAVERRKVDPPVRVHGAEVSEAVSKITWTASSGAEIKPGEFMEFPVSMGPLPDVDQMVFKALQTYSDGSIIRWIEEPPAGGGEAANPAPVLRLVPAAAGATAAPGSAADGVARGLGIAGLVAGLAGLALGGLALIRLRARRPDGAPAAERPEVKADA